MNRKITALCMLLLCFQLSGCSIGKKPESSGPFIYYLNTSGTGLATEDYKKKQGDVEKEIDQMLKALKTAPDSIEYQSAIPEAVKIDGYTFDNGKLRLDFNQEYSKMPKVEEVLCRAAIIKTLTQNTEIHFVEFYIAGVALTDAEGNIIGPMRRDDFIQNMGSEINTYQAATLELYFANKSGDKLVKETVNVRYNSNISMEKLIVEQLMKGPSGENEIKTIPPETKLIGISVKDGVCYVNFDEGFLGKSADMDPKITIYSIVNSIVAGGNVNFVQISINGESKINFRGTVKLEEPFQKNEKLVEESK